MTLPRVPLIIGDQTLLVNPLRTVLDALNFDQRGTPPEANAVLTAPAARHFAHAAAAALTEIGHPARVILPPPRGLRSVLGANWTSVTLANPAARFVHVSFLRSLAPPRPIWLVLDLDADPALPFTAIMRYVHPRLVAAVRVSRPDDGAAAEVALAFNVVGVLLSSTVQGRRRITGTTDIVAAQLLALAFRALAEHEDPDAIGPWQNPTVQRATELGLGLAHPGQLDVTCRPEHAAEVERLCHSVCMLLGID